MSTPCQNNARGDLLTSVLLANVRRSDVTRMQPRISYTQVAVAETMCVSLGHFAIFALVASLLATPLPERGVKLCFIPCREVRVNASDIREVFVSNCALAKVEIVGDPRTVTIRDSAGPCGKFKYFY